MRNFLTTLVLSSVIFSFGVAADKEAKSKAAKSKRPEVTKEDRAKMAESHEKMAACLKSEKPMEECHKEMHQGCEAMGDSCPMHRGHGKGHGHHGPPEGAPPAPPAEK